MERHRVFALGASMARLDENDLARNCAAKIDQGRRGRPLSIFVLIENGRGGYRFSHRRRQRLRTCRKF
jgi:hypothetical protein